MNISVRDVCWEKKGGKKKNMFGKSPHAASAGTNGMSIHHDQDRVYIQVAGVSLIITLIP